MDIGKRLRELRKAKGLSQHDIEKRTGMLTCYLSRVECGHALPEVGTLERWAKALDLELYQLFYQGKGEPMAPELAEPTPRNTREGTLLNLFRRMPERDRGLFLALARKAVKQREKHK
jgi:transcriptional regulator with XRE-family HTH domain